MGRDEPLARPKFKLPTFVLKLESFAWIKSAENLLPISFRYGLIPHGLFISLRFVACRAMKINFTTNNSHRSCSKPSNTVADRKFGLPMSFF